MPLHLLPKKSWNPYNPAAIAKVRADEAAAAALEEANDQRQQEYDADRRLALLRGLPAPPLPAAPNPTETPSLSRPERSAKSSEFRKRRKVAGEDDTDRDLRLVREDAAENERRRQQQQEEAGKKHTKNDAPLIDRAGHIQLFAAPSARGIRAEKNAEAEAEKKKTEREFEDQYTMRFSNAAGFQIGIKDQPWYATAREEVGYTGTEELEPQALTALGKDAFGRRDDGRNRRDEVRLRIADPMAVMKRAQVKLKEVGREREVWAMEKKREFREMKEMWERDARRSEQKRRRTGEDELDGFSLDALHDGRHARIQKHENSSSSQHRAHNQERHRAKRRRSRSHERNGVRALHHVT